MGKLFSAAGLCCLLLLANQAVAAAKDKTVILYGGLSFVDDQATPAMARFLSNAAEGSALTQGDLLLNAAETSLTAFNRTGALRKLSAHDIIITNDDAWALARYLGAENQVEGRLIDILQARSERIYALLLLSTYEEVHSHDLAYTDAQTGEKIPSTRSVYTTAISALLVEIDPAQSTRRIVLSSSGMGTVAHIVRQGVTYTDGQQLVMFREAYQRSIDDALTNLQYAQPRNTASLGAGFSHMVTGFAMQESAPASLLGYDLGAKPTLQDLQSDMCHIPSGCVTDGCRKTGKLLVHGLTTALSAGGYSVLPPLDSDYAVDTDRNIQLNLSLYGTEIEQLTGQQRVLVSPSDAATKWIAVWRGSEWRDEIDPLFPVGMRDRVYYSRVGYVRAQTGFDGCSGATGIERDPIDSNSSAWGAVKWGCSVESYNLELGQPLPEVDRGHYLAASLDHMTRLGHSMRAGTRTGDIVCEPYDRTD